MTLDSSVVHASSIACVTRHMCSLCARCVYQVKISRRSRGSVALWLELSRFGDVASRHPLPRASEVRSSLRAALVLGACSVALSVTRVCCLASVLTRCGLLPAAPLTPTAARAPLATAAAMPFRRYVSVGRVAYVNLAEDPLFGKLVVIVDIVDQNRVRLRDSCRLP